MLKVTSWSYNKIYILWKKNSLKLVKVSEWVIYHMLTCKRQWKQHRTRLYIKYNAPNKVLHLKSNY
jgi:hypothetical protein